MSISGDGFLLDTNVISEVSRPRPDPRAMAWLAETDEERMFLSVATLAEIKLGIERLAAGKRRRRLEAWLADELVARFDRRILPVDVEIGLQWGSVVARAPGRRAVRSKPWTR
jgi:predicted nucleic acid-binding protein